VSLAGTTAPPHRALAASFGPPAAALASSSPLRLVSASPADGCGGAPAWAGAAVLAWRGNCSFAAKAAAATAAGAVALIVANTGPGGPVRMADDAGGGGTVGVPALGVGAASGRALQAAAAAGDARVTFARETLPEGRGWGAEERGGERRHRAPTTPPPRRCPSSARFESLAYFSSSGPTLDGRLKPDVTAPGTTVSAYSDGWEGTGRRGAGGRRARASRAPPPPPPLFP